MKTIAYLVSYGAQLFNPEKNLDESFGVFGSELALLETASRLGKFANIDVFIYKDSGYFLNKWNINWRSAQDWDTYLETTTPDVIMVVRYINIFIDYYLPPKSKIMVWLHDPYCLLHHQNGMQLPPTMVKNIEPLVDQWLCVGKYQWSEKIQPLYNLKNDKVTVIRNGITLEKGFNPMVTVRKPLSFVWCSCPTRGLWPFLERWSAIRKVFPLATLTIYYTKSEESAQKFKPYESDKSINYVGKVPQSVLFNTLKNTDYWLYWCGYYESCCTTIMEAAYYGAIPITNRVGGLKENLETPCLIDCDPYECDRFYNMAIHLISQLEANPTKKLQLRQQYYDWSLKQTWDERLPEWKKVFGIEN